MGPSKVLRKINRISIKRYEDSPNSSKERKITEISLKWSHGELTQFYKAYHRYGKDWKKISAVVGSKSSAMVEALYNMHRTFLSLPKRQATAMRFMALVTVHHCNVLDEDGSSSNRGNDHKVQTSGNVKKLGEATLQKVHEEPYSDDSCPQGSVPGCSPSFKKRYYGELARNSHSHIVGSRTLRMPVIVSADRDVTRGNRDTNSPTIDINEVTTNAGTKFTLKESSPDGSCVVMEATEAVQAQTFFEIQGIEDSEICHTQQYSKRRRTGHTVDGCRINKFEHETVVVCKEGNKSVSLQNQQEILTELISADDMLVLDVLQSLVNTHVKTSKLKINIPSDGDIYLSSTNQGTLEKSEAALSHTVDNGHPLGDLSEQGKLVGRCSTSKTCHNRQEKMGRYFSMDSELRLCAT